MGETPGPVPISIAFASRPKLIPLKPPTQKTRQDTSFVAWRWVLSVQFVEQISRKKGIFRVFRREGRRNFSAVQTAWRSGKDSNPRYRSEWRKSRCLRKLQGINSLSGEPGPSGAAALWQTSAVCGLIERRMAGDAVAKSGLHETLRDQLGSRPTACLPRSPTSKDILRARRSPRGEWMAISGDSWAAFLTRHWPQGRHMFATCLIQSSC